MEFFTGIGAGVTGSAIVTGALVFIFKEAIKTWFGHAADVELARVTTDLESTAEKSNMRYLQMSERRINVIADVFGLIKKTQSSMKQLASPFQQVLVEEEYRASTTKINAALRILKTDQLNRAAEDFNEFTKLFESNRLFLPAKTCGHIDKLINEFRDAHFEMETALDEDQWEKSEIKQNRQMKRDAWERVSNSIPRIANELEATFRVLAGAEES